MEPVDWLWGKEGKARLIKSTLHRNLYLQLLEWNQNCLPFLNPPSDQFFFCLHIATSTVTEWNVFYDEGRIRPKSQFELFGSWVVLVVKLTTFEETTLAMLTNLVLLTPLVLSTTWILIQFEKLCHLGRRVAAAAIGIRFSRTVNWDVFPGTSMAWNNK